MICKHFEKGRCFVDCRCNGEPSKCEFVCGITDDSSGTYRFLLSKTMDLLTELKEHMTCSLPCIYCKKYDSNTVCDGEFEWIYEKRINELLGRKDSD